MTDNNLTEEEFNEIKNDFPLTKIAYSHNNHPDLISISVAGDLSFVGFVEEYTISVHGERLPEIKDHPGFYAPGQVWEWDGRCWVLICPAADTDLEEEWLLNELEEGYAGYLTEDRLRDEARFIRHHEPRVGDSFLDPYGGKMKFWASLTRRGLDNSLHLRTSYGSISYTEENFKAMIADNDIQLATPINLISRSQRRAERQAAIEDQIKSGQTRRITWW